MKKFYRLMMATAILALSMNSSVSLAKRGIGGIRRMPVEFYGQASSATTGAAALVFTITGLKAGSECLVTPKSYGTGPASFTKAVVTLNTITLTVDVNQTAGSTVINYICFKP